MKKDREKLCFLLLTQVENYINRGTDKEITSFENFLLKEFDIGELDRHDFTVMGTEITQIINKSIGLTQKMKLDAIDLAQIKTLSSAQKGNAIVRPRNITSFGGVIRKMLFIGRISQYAILYHASHMATKTPKLMMHHLKDLTSLLKDNKKDIPTISFPASAGNSKFSLETYSDAAMSNNHQNAGRGGFIIFRR